MRRSARMDVDRRAQLGKARRRASMIEMNVTQKNMTHILRRITNPAQFRADIVESRFRAGIEQN